MVDDRGAVFDPYVEAHQQRVAGRIGMWVFLASEVMMFGGLFMVYAVYRIGKAEAVKAAAHHLDMWLGGANTAILLTSSLTMALAVLAAERERAAALVGWLAATAGLGMLFAGLKVHEYTREYHEGLMPGIGPAFPIDVPGAELYFNLYFVGTGLHLAHLGIGIGVLVLTALLVVTGRLSPTRCPQRLRMVGLYWHFVDVVWIFLYPVLYLAGR